MLCTGNAAILVGRNTRLLSVNAMLSVTAKALDSSGPSQAMALPAASAECRDFPVIGNEIF
jgi:hypothetical protein